jgi:ribonuclease P protein component
VPRQYSLKLRSDFKRLYKHGIRKNSKNFQIIFVDADSLKFGYLVKKDDIKRANRRNYTKRVIREIVRKEIFPIFQDKKMHVGISCKVDLKELRKTVEFKEIQDELIALIQQINFNAPAFKKDQKRTFDNKRLASFTSKNRSFRSRSNNNSR